jgi:hypothetical protein
VDLTGACPKESFQKEDATAKPKTKKEKKEYVGDRVPPITIYSEFPHCYFLQTTTSNYPH